MPTKWSRLKKYQVQLCLWGEGNRSQINSNSMYFSALWILWLLYQTDMNHYRADQTRWTISYVFKLMWDRSCRSVPSLISILWTTTRRTTWRRPRRPRTRSPRPTAASPPTPRCHRVTGARASRGRCRPRPRAERAPWPGSRGRGGEGAVTTWTLCRHAHWPGAWRGAGLTSHSHRPARRARRPMGCRWCHSRSRSCSTAK